MVTRGINKGGNDDSFSQEPFEDEDAGKAFAATFNKITEDYGITQEQIAVIAGIAASRISEMKRGDFNSKEKTRASHLEKIGKAIIGLARDIKLSRVNALLPPVRLSPEHKTALMATFEAYRSEKTQNTRPLKQLTPAPSDLTGYELVTSNTSFIGRTRELVIIREALTNDTTPIITITGTAGVGKTKLALEVAMHLFTEPAIFPGEYKFIRLTEMNSESHIARAVATALGVTEITIKSIVASLPTARSLLILDNLEFLQERECKEFILSFLWTCKAQNKKVTLLITSQNPLDFDTRLQTTIQLEPLALPPYDKTPKTIEELQLYAATDLFYRRMDQQMQLYPLAADDVKAITELCKQLDGLPLAIELASPTISKTALPQVVYASFMKSLTSLRTQLEDVDPRHKSLVAALSWSFNQLTPTQQKLLRRLAIFSGRFTIEAVREICNAPGDIKGDIEALFLDLVRRNQVQRETPREPETKTIDGTWYKPEINDSITWYILLNTIRRYVLQALTSDREVDAIAKMHCFYFVSLQLKLVVEMQRIIYNKKGGYAVINELILPQLRLYAFNRDNLLYAQSYLKYHPNIKTDLAEYINAAGITPPSHISALINSLENGYVADDSYNQLPL